MLYSITEISGDEICQRSTRDSHREEENRVRSVKVSGPISFGQDSQKESVTASECIYKRKLIPRMYRISGVLREQRAALRHSIQRRPVDVVILHKTGWQFLAITA